MNLQHPSPRRQSVRLTQTVNPLSLERYNEIEKQNRHLLDRMTDIIVNPQPLYPSSDGKIHEPYVKNTLNAGFRKRELERITKENYQLL